VGADVDLELAGVDGGEEVLAEPRGEDAERCQREDEEEDQKDAGVMDGQGKQLQVTSAEALKTGLEALLEPDQRIAAAAGLVGGMGLEQVLGHGGNQGSREQIAGQHGEDHGLGHGHK